MEGQGFASMQHNEQIMEKYRELRRANVKLLEEKRELLVQLQLAKRGDQEDDHSTRLSETCEDLKDRIKDLERQLEETKRQADFQRCVSISSVGDETLFGEASSECHCACSSKLKEAIKVNHQWNDTFQRAANRYHEAEKRCRRLEDELKTETEENSVLKELIKKLENDLKNSQKHSYSRSSSREFCSKDDVEALKLQLLAYQEDFNTEKEENEKKGKDIKAFEKKLEDANDFIRSLSDQLIQHKNHVLKMSQDKERVRQELRRLADDSYSYDAIRRPLYQNFSFPLSSEELPLSSSATARTPPILRRSDSDLFKGGRVVRDS